MNRPTYDQIVRLQALHKDLRMKLTIPETQEHVDSYIEALEKLKRITTKIQREENINAGL